MPAYLWPNTLKSLRAGISQQKMTPVTIIRICKRLENAAWMLVILLGCMNGSARRREKPYRRAHETRWITARSPVSVMCEPACHLATLQVLLKQIENPGTRGGISPPSPHPQSRKSIRAVIVFQISATDPFREVLSRRAQPPHGAWFFSPRYYQVNTSWSHEPD